MKRRRVTALLSPLLLAAVCALSVLPTGAQAASVPSPGWSIVASANSSAIQTNEFNGVSCTSAVFCMGVGEFLDLGLNATNETLIEQWNGFKWSIVPAPIPNTGQANELYGVSCKSETLCIAVGFYIASQGGPEQPLVEQWNGSIWSVTPSPFISGSLSGVSCSSVTFCVAVGSVFATDTVDTLIEKWDGIAWSVMASPSSGDVENELSDVSCTSSSACTAVGSYTPGGPTAPTLYDQTLAEKWNGTTWSIISSPNIGAVDNQLYGVSCLTATSCTAVGANEISGFIDQTLIERWNGSTWSIIPSPNEGASTNLLVSVSCTSSSICTAVGSYYVGNASFTLIEQSVGSTWSAVPSPNFPPQNKATPEYNQLNSVSCTSESVCTAAGSSQGPSGVTQTLAVLNYAPLTPPAPPVTSPSTSSVHGYWLVGSDGGIFSFGSAQFYGSAGSLKLQRPVVGIVPTKDDGGYWLDASDGGIFAYGDTQFYGSIPGLGLHPAGSGLPNSLDAPIVGMVPSNDDGGYFMVASDGGVFAFGDAHFAGSCPGIGGCSGAAVAVMPDASGNGYWLVTRTGSVYTFGDAGYYGAPGNTGSPVTSAVRTPDGGGYWILTANGTVYNYGDAGNYGDAAGAFGGFNPATAIFTTTDGNGYWITSANGTVDQYGDAPNDGDMSGTNLNGSIIAATGF